jgi:hypothetical protein
MKLLKKRYYKQLILGSLLFFSYQNCSKIAVVPLKDSPQAKAIGTDTGVPGNDGDAPIDGETPTGTPPNTGNPATTPDPREINCKGMTGVPAIVYDSRVLQGTPAVSMSGFAGNRGTLEAETVSEVSRFAGSINVVAATIQSISSFATSNVSFNAKEIGEMHSFAAAQAQVVTHHLGETENLAGDLCVSAQSIDAIRNLASRLSLFGRNENGQKAKIGELRNIAGFVAVYNFDVGTASPLSGAAIVGKFVNSHISKLENAAIDITLIDSVLDDASNVAGIIRLKGNSKVLKTGSGVALHIE